MDALTPRQRHVFPWILLASIALSPSATSQTRSSRGRRHRPVVVTWTSGPVAPEAAALEVPGSLPPNPYEAPAPAVEAPAVEAPAPALVAPAPAVEAPAPALVAPAPAPPAPTVAVAPALAPPGTMPPNPYRAGRREGRRFGRVAEDDILMALRYGSVQGRLRNYGNTSVNIRVDFPGPVDGSYKPAESRHTEHWRAEIAAFRLNQLLGLERVPPSVFRRVPQDELPTGPQYGVTFEEGFSHGAMIYWVPVLRPSGVGSQESLAHWSAQLMATSRIAPTDMARAEEVSSLFVFDYLIANWDRWNGLNTLEDGDGHLIYRDNNAGFQEPPRSGHGHVVDRYLHLTQRFSRSLVEHARALTLESLRDAMADDGDGDVPLLEDAQLRGVLRRRDNLVRYVDDLVRRYGEREVFPFE